MLALTNITLAGAWVFLLVGCLLLVWLHALISCIRRRDIRGGEKIAWIIVILLTSYPGLIAYFIFSSSRHRAQNGGRYPKAINPATGRQERPTP